MREGWRKEVREGRDKERGKGGEDRGREEWRERRGEASQACPLHVGDQNEATKALSSILVKQMKEDLQGGKG